MSTRLAESKRSAASRESTRLAESKVSTRSAVSKESTRVAESKTSKKPTGPKEFTEPKTPKEFKEPKEPTAPEAKKRPRKEVAKTTEEKTRQPHDGARSDPERTREEHARNAATESSKSAASKHYTGAASQQREETGVPLCPRAGTAPGTSKVRSRDWTCPKCGNFNWAIRGFCNRKAPAHSAAYVSSAVRLPHPLPPRGHSFPTLIRATNSAVDSLS